jgi:iron-sulfur cluster repair protein YtfE (RIC family)
MSATPGEGGISGEQRTPEEIEQQIEGTREELARTLDALESRLSPRRRLNQAADTMRATGEHLVSRGLNAVTPDITTMIRMDHTHVLAVFRRFKPFTPPGKKRALATNACLALEVHAQLEEEIFYPALREAVGSNPLLDQSLHDHDSMRKLISRLRALEVGEPGFDDTFRELMREVLHHVADEETVLLPLADEVLGEQLGALGMAMTKRRMQLLKPHARDVALSSVRSFPVLFGAAAAGIALLGWLAVRPGGRIH